LAQQNAAAAGEKRRGVLDVSSSDESILEERQQASGEEGNDEEQHASEEDSDDDPGDAAFKPAEDSGESEDDSERPKSKKDKAKKPPHRSRIPKPHQPSRKRNASALVSSSSTSSTPRSTPNRKKKPAPQFADDPARDTGELSALLIHAREAFNDIRPRNPPVKPFIYWDPEVTFACAAMLVSRFPHLQDMARRYDKSNDLAKKWAQKVKTQANNERSAQIRVIKATWLNNDSPISFTSYTITTPPVVSLSVPILETNFGDGHNNVSNLQALICSDDALSNPVFYDFLCSGLESGNFKNTSPMGVSTISELCTPSHEAHIRVELWFILPHWNYNHPINKGHAHERIAKWKEILPLVVADREEHEAAAHVQRMSSCGADGTREDDEDVVLMDDVNEKYWR
jgi:hypothetical protein